MEPSAVTDLYGLFISSQAVNVGLYRMFREYGHEACSLVHKYIQRRYGRVHSITSGEEIRRSHTHPRLDLITDNRHRYEVSGIGISRTTIKKRLELDVILE